MQKPGNVRRVRQKKQPLFTVRETHDWPRFHQRITFGLQEILMADGDCDASDVFRAFCRCSLSALRDWHDRQGIKLLVSRRMKRWIQKMVLLMWESGPNWKPESESWVYVMEMLKANPPVVCSREMKISDALCECLDRALVEGEALINAPRVLNEIRRIERDGEA